MKNHARAARFFGAILALVCSVAAAQTNPLTTHDEVPQPQAEAPQAAPSATFRLEADDSFNPNKPLATTAINKIPFFQNNRIITYGWAQFGIMGNEYGAANSYGGGLPAILSRDLDAFSGNSFLLGTQTQSDFKVSQLWFGVSRRADGKDGPDWGIQFDTLFGTDGKYPQSFGDKSFDYGWGSGDYFLAIAQLYAECAYGKFKLRAGKFAPDAALEPLPAPYTFFLSHSYSCYSTALTAAGVGLEYEVMEDLSVFFAVTNGFNTFFGNRFDDCTFLAKFSYKPWENVAISYNTFFGQENGYNKLGMEAFDYDRAFDKRFSFMNTLILTVQIDKSLRYAIEGHWSTYDNSGISAIGQGDYNTYDLGITQHLIYTVMDGLEIGGRFEWYKGKGTLFDAQPYTGGSGTEIFELTFGLNWFPLEYLSIRPEIRYDWTDYSNGTRPFDNGTQKNQLSFGCSVVLVF